MAVDTEETGTTDAPEAYDRLVEHVRRYTNVEHATGLLHWDQQVMMPEGGTPARSQQLSTLSALSHELVTDDEVAALLDDLDEADLDGERAALVREVRRKHERAARVPTDLVEEISRVSSEGVDAWEAAKEEDDWDAFAPYLEEMVDLKRQYAEQIDPDRDAYEVLFEDYEPCLPLSQAEEILEELKTALVPMIDEIRASDVELATDAFAGEFDVDAQEELSREALSTLGYDWDRGRLDVSTHPFTSGTQFDARVTTRFDEADHLGALTATIHEFGHARYQLGLPDDAYGTPLGEPRDLSVHESQSRLWENHVGRSRAWWELFAPAVRERFPSLEVTPEEAYEAANQVYEDNLIRVEADELTYHLHVVVRFEIERALIAGDLDVSEVPEAWNDRYEQYLGIRPDTDREGCLQDIHWSQGSIGYFPTYSLGSVMAAQLFDALERDVGDVHDRVREGEFDAIHDWLVEHVHRHGKRYETNDLVREATGEDFAADHFVDYVREKYGALYDLTESV